MFAVRALSLTASQIDDLKFTFHLLRRGFKKVALNSNREQAMGATRCVIHFVRTHDLMLLSLVPPLQSLFRVATLPFKHVLDCELV